MFKFVQLCQRPGETSGNVRNMRSDRGTWLAMSIASQKGHVEAVEVWHLPQSTTKDVALKFDEWTRSYLKLKIMCDVLRLDDFYLCSFESVRLLLLLCVQP